MKIQEICKELEIEVPPLFLVQKRLFDTAQDPQAMFGAGYLGEEKKSFMPSPYFLEKYATKSPHKVLLRKKAAYLFTCARDVFSQGIESISTHKTDALVVVYDQDKRPIGLATVQRGTVALKNVFDIGHILRREMTRSSQ
jgi:ribosome biogenesis protein Nip4